MSNHAVLPILLGFMDFISYDERYLRTKDLIIKYHCYRCKKDYKGLLKLNEKYPKWRKVKLELKKLERREVGH